MQGRAAPCQIHPNIVKNLAQRGCPTAGSVTVKVAGDYNTNGLRVWVAGSLKINDGDTDIAAGGVALAGEKAIFKNVKVGYDNNADDDIADAGDDLVLNETFASTQSSFTYDDNGNLTADENFAYEYDPWNRLVKVTARNDGDVVIGQYHYDGLGRRIQKVVSNSGDLDGALDRDDQTVMTAVAVLPSTLHRHPGRGIHAPKVHRLFIRSWGYDWHDHRMAL